MNRLMKHAVAALVLASPAMLNAQQPTPAKQPRRPAAAQGSKKLALPTINRRSFDWLLGEAKPTDDKAPADDESPADDSASPPEPQAQQPASESPRPQSERNFKATKPSQPAAQGAETAPDDKATATPAAPAAQVIGQPAASPVAKAPALPKPIAPIVVRAQPARSVAMAPLAKQPATAQAAVPAGAAQSTQTAAPLPRIVISQPQAVARSASTHSAPGGNSRGEPSPSAGNFELPAVAVLPEKSNAAEVVAPRANTRALVSSSLRYGPVSRDLQPAAMAATTPPAPSPVADNTPSIHLVESAPQLRLTPIAARDDSPSGLAATPVEPEDLAASRPLRPQPASALAMFAQGPPGAARVSATASPSTILRTLHTYGAIGTGDSADDADIGQQFSQHPSTAQPIPTTSPEPRPQQPTLAAAPRVQPAGHAAVQAAATAKPTVPTPATEATPGTMERQEPAAEPARLPEGASQATGVPQPAQPPAAPATSLTKPTFPTMDPSAAASGQVAETSTSSGKSATSAGAPSIKDRIAAIVTLKQSPQPSPQPAQPTAAQPAPQAVAQPAAPPAADASSPTPQLPQPRSIRVKVLHGTVVRVNAQAGHVALAFTERAELAPGTRVQVYRRELLKRQQLGEVEVTSAQGDQFVARPIGNLKATQISVEDELVVVP